MAAALHDAELVRSLALSADSLSEAPGQAMPYLCFNIGTAFSAGSPIASQAAAQLSKKPQVQKPPLKPSPAFRGRSAERPERLRPSSKQAPLATTPYKQFIAIYSNS